MINKEYDLAIEDPSGNLTIGIFKCLRHHGRGYYYFYSEHLGKDIKLNRYELYVAQNRYTHLNMKLK